MSALPRVIVHGIVCCIKGIMFKISALKCLTITRTFVMLESFIYPKCFHQCLYQDKFVLLFKVT